MGKREEKDGGSGKKAWRRGQYPGKLSLCPWILDVWRWRSGFKVRSRKEKVPGRAPSSKAALKDGNCEEKSQGRQLQRVRGASLKGQAQAGKWQGGWGGGEGLGPDSVLGVGHPAPSGCAKERQESWSLGKLPLWESDWPEEERVPPLLPFDLLSPFDCDDLSHMGGVDFESVLHLMPHLHSP